MTYAIMAATGLAVVFVAVQLRGGWNGPIAAYDAAPAPGRPAAHVGATADWSPAAEVAADAPAVTVSHAEADLVERTILADFDALIDSWRADPDWLAEWRDSVDAFHHAHGIDTAAHHRWRWGVVDVPTGEYPLVKTLEGNS